MLKGIKIQLYKEIAVIVAQQYIEEIPKKGRNKDYYGLEDGKREHNEENK